MVFNSSCRAHRFKPSQPEKAAVTFLSDSRKTKYHALVVDESYSGFNLVMTGEVAPEIGEQILLVYQSKEILARIVWIRNWDEQVWRMGIQKQLHAPSPLNF